MSLSLSEEILLRFPPSYDEFEVRGPDDRVRSVIKAYDGTVLTDTHVVYPRSLNRASAATVVTAAFECVD